MNQFIADYPGVVYLLGVALVGCAIYFYKKAEKAEKSAILLEIGKAVVAIENMANQIKTLFEKDSHRRNETQVVRQEVADLGGELKERMGKQETKCDERILYQCSPGQHARSGDLCDYQHKRQGDNDGSG